MTKYIDIITAMGSAPNGINATTKCFKAENGLVFDFEKSKIDKNGKVIGNEV